MDSPETADDPATRALLEQATAYDCTVTVDEEELAAYLVGPPGTSKLTLSVHEDNELGFEVGEATWLSLYIGDADAAERAEGARYVATAVLTGRIVEEVWTRDGRIVRTRLMFLDTGETYHWQYRLGKSGPPDRLNTFDPYPARRAADH